MKIYIKNRKYGGKETRARFVLESRVFLACFEIGEEIIVLYFY